MVIRLIREGRPLHEILFYDTVEGDIVNAEVYYDVGCYPHTEIKKIIVKIPDIYRISYRSFEVIGNIHDNSELLTGDSNV